mmetsp:Transcript_13395/g.42089  ORF Transcript_13395/g.42089 Transcript_13395/m.42089 type:complete len:328 (+) Transcript_13395:342-1325(+)
MRLVGLEELGHLGAPALHKAAWQPPQARRGRPRPGVELGDVEHGEAEVTDELQRRSMVLLGLRGEAADDVRGYCELRHRLAQASHEPPEICGRVLPDHGPQDLVGARLHGHVQKAEDVGPPQHLRHGRDVRQDVRRVRHAQLQHHAWGQRVRDPGQQRSNARADVQAVGPSVLRREPDLARTLCCCLQGPAHDGLYAVGGEPAPGVLGLAVGAVAQAAATDGDDLHAAVPPDLGKLQGGQRPPLPQELHDMAPERLLHDLHHPVDLRDVQHADVPQALDERGVSGGHTARQHHRLALLLGSLGEVQGRVLAGVLHRAGVHDAGVGVL